MKAKWILLALACGCLGRAGSTLGVEARAPNVLVIYSDDQGSVDLGCYGAEDLETPHLDRLALHGVRFTSMYAPSAICSASRAGLMTGRLPHRAGVPGNVSSSRGRAGMPDEQTTLAELLRAQGYRTGHVGKWHLGYTPETMPMGQGFDQSFGHMGGCIDNYSHFFYWAGPNRHDLWRNGQEVFHDGEYFGGLMVDEVKAFLKASRDAPFFLYWAINFPHYPMQATAQWRERYKGLSSPRRQYAAFVSTMDEMIGEALAELTRLGLREDTVIVFQSDHGHSVEERAFFGGGDSGGLRGAKGCLFEGGIRAPSIVSYPGVFPENETRDAVVHGTDWFATIADLCGATVKGLDLDGVSLRSVIESASAPSPHESLYWRLGGGARPQWAVREGAWKLLGNPRDTTAPDSLGPYDALFLVDLERDPQERVNLRDQRPDIVERLMQRHQRELDRPLR